MLSALIINSGYEEEANDRCMNSQSDVLPNMSFFERCRAYGGFLGKLSLGFRQFWRLSCVVVYFFIGVNQIQWHGL